MFDQQPAPKATEDSDAEHRASDFGDFDDPFSSPAGRSTDNLDTFGSDTSDEAQNYGEVAQPRFPSIASNAEPAPALSSGANDADLDAAFGPDDYTTTGDTGPFASTRTVASQPSGPWPRAVSGAPVADPRAGAEGFNANASMKPTSSAPWASPMVAAPSVSDPSSRPRTNDDQRSAISSARLQAADAENLQLRSQIASLSAEASQLQSTTALEAIAAQRESENEELRLQLSKLTKEVAENTELYQRKLADGEDAETAQRNLREEIERLEIELHRQNYALLRQTEINEEIAAKRETLLQVKTDLAAKVEADKGALETLQSEHTAMAKEVKTMEVNLEYEKMAAGKLAAEVDRLRSKLDEQAQTLRDRKQSYEGHERQVRQLRDERLLLQARATQAAAGAASVEAQRRHLEAPGLGLGSKQAEGSPVTAGGESDDPFGLSDQGSPDSNPFGASSDEEVQQPDDDPFAVADGASIGATPFDSPPSFAGTCRRWAVQLPPRGHATDGSTSWRCGG